MLKKIRIPIKITYRQPVVRVTRSGKLYCNNCGTLNEAVVGQTNPVCGKCRHPLV